METLTLQISQTLRANSPESLQMDIGGERVAIVSYKLENVFMGAQGPAGPAVQFGTLDQQVLFDDAGVVRGDSGLLFNKTTKTITIGGATVTVSVPVVSATQTWNAAAVVFTALKINVTDTASAAGSLLADLQVGGVSKFSVRKDGVLTTQEISGPSGGGYLALRTTASANILFGVNGANLVAVNNSVGVRLANGLALGFGSTADANTSPSDVFLYRDGAGVLALRNGANAQEDRLYGTYTDSLNYQRLTRKYVGTGATPGFLITTEGAGTGAATDLVLNGATGVTHIAGDFHVGRGSSNSQLLLRTLANNAASGSGVISFRTADNASLSSISFYTAGNAATLMGAAVASGLGIVSSGHIGIYTSGKDINLGGVSTTAPAWSIKSTGHLYPGAGVTYDIGATLNPIRNIYAAGVQTFYGGWTDGLNNYGLTVGWQGGGLQFNTFFNGTGNGGGQPTAQYNAATHVFGVGTTGKWQIDGLGIRPYGIAGNDNTMDFCTSTYRARTGYFGTSVVVGSLTILDNTTTVDLNTVNSKILTLGGGNPVRVPGTAGFIIGNGASPTFYSSAGASLELRNAGQALTFYIYQNYVDGSNYSRLKLGWLGTTLGMLADAAGTGTTQAMQVGTLGSQPLSFVTGGTNRWQVDTSGNWIPTSASTYNIGSAAAPVAALWSAGTVTHYISYTDSANNYGLSIEGSSGTVRLRGFSSGTGAQPVIALDAGDHVEMRVAGVSKAGFYGTYCLPTSNDSYDLGVAGQAFRYGVFSRAVVTVPHTVATLPAAATAGAGARTAVTDSTVAAAGNYGAVVAGGGANVVPVFSTGTAWIIA